jgi:CBS domain containing-hemolysin-like protein
VTSILVVAGSTLVASFLCSLFEAALYSVPPSQIEMLRARGVRGAERLARLRENVDEPIAAILTVNTIAHTVGAAWCGAMVGEEFGSQAVGVFAAIFTLLVLALTEIVPKSLGVRYAPVLAPAVALPLQLMIWSTWPVVWLAQRVMRRLGSGGAVGPSEDEVLAVSRLAARSGGVRSDEHRWVRNALRLDRVTAGELRTPRTVVETLDADRPLADLVAHLEGWVHTRVPVVEDAEPDKVIGLAHRREVLDTALQRPDEGLIVRDLLRPIEFVPETMPGNELLDLFLAARTHMVAVIDEYGGFEGIVTLEDVLENLLGEEIVDEHDQVADMQELALERARRRHAPPESGGTDSVGADAPSRAGHEPPESAS